MDSNDARNRFAMSCSVKTADVGSLTPFVRASWDDRAGYDAAMLAYIGQSGAPALKSIYGQRYDLYYDLVLRHYGSEQPAIRLYERGAGWRQLNYRQLDGRVRGEAARWLERGVAAGDVIVILLPFGLAYVVSVLAALRLGCLPAPLMPLGERYVVVRVKALKPALIVTEQRYLRFLKDYRGKVLDERGVATQDEVKARSHTYGFGDVAMLAFSPLREPLTEPLEVRSDQLHRNALRDGLATLALKPGSRVAAPGMHMGQHQPSLLLATLAAGGCFVHVSNEALAEEPGLLLEEPLRSVGVSAWFRDLLLDKRPGPAKRWQHWFRNPEEPFDWQSWMDFIEALELREIPRSNAVFDCAAGGAVLCSLRATGPGEASQPDNALLPAPGAQWALLDVNGSGQEAVGSCGLFVPIPPAEKPPKPKALAKSAYLLLYGRRQDYLYAGTLAPRRSGRAYPIEEVLALVQELEWVQAASWIPVSSGGTAVHYLFVLMLFVGSDEVRALPPGSHQTLAAQAAQLIVEQLGEEHRPDRVEVYPLHARAKGKATDHGWCQSQYLTGRLFEKSRTPVFQQLTALRELSLQP